MHRLQVYYFQAWYKNYIVAYVWQLPDKEIHNFTTDWVDGRLLYALVRAFEPGALPSQIPDNPLTVAKMAIEAACKYFMNFELNSDSR
jgi:hypothetical protein